MKPRAAKPKPKVAPILAPAVSEKLTKDEFIALRMPGKWRRNIEAELAKLGVPDRRRSDFYRGAIVAGVLNARRSTQPEWKAFIEAIQPMAQKHLGMDILNDDVEGLLDEGAIRATIGA